MTMTTLGRAALADLAGVLDRLPDDAADPLIETILASRRIVLYGCGREGLAMRGFCMRLFHMGRDAHMLGDMTTPPVGPGDLLFVSAGPGRLASASTFLRIAKEAGAATAVVTAEPEGETAKAADVMFVIPAQTMASDRAAKRSVLPMGSLFEIAQALLFELVILALRERTGETAETMRARHTNLE